MENQSFRSIQDLYRTRELSKDVEACINGIETNSHKKEGKNAEEIFAHEVNKKIAAKGGKVDYFEMEAILQEVQNDTIKREKNAIVNAVGNIINKNLNPSPDDINDPDFRPITIVERLKDKERKKILEKVENVQFEVKKENPDDFTVTIFHTKELYSAEKNSISSMIKTAEEKISSISFKKTTPKISSLN